MKQSKIDEAVRNLTGIARKVFDACPRQEAWGIPQICAEMRRQGANPARNVVEGCLASLIDLGLIKQIGPRALAQYQQVIAKITLETRPQPITTAPIDMPTPAPATENDTLSLLASIATEARKLSDHALSLARAIDDAAVKVEDRVSAVQQESEKLKQLQVLLKSLGV